MAVKQADTYILEDQIGHILRKVSQRHTGIFSSIMPADLTPTRFAVLAKLLEQKSLSQNELGRLTAMDVATIKGVVDRLRQRALVKSRIDPNDARRQIIELTPKGHDLVEKAIPLAEEVTRLTIEPMSEVEAQQLAGLLKKIS